MSTYVHWCKNVPTAVAKNWRQFKFTEEWINRSGYIHTMQDYTAIKKKKIEVQTIWMNLTEGMLAKRIRTKEYMLYDPIYMMFKSR